MVPTRRISASTAASSSSSLRVRSCRLARRWARVKGIMDRMDWDREVGGEEEVVVAIYLLRCNARTQTRQLHAMPSLPSTSEVQELIADGHHMHITSIILNLMHAAYDSIINVRCFRGWLQNVSFSRSWQQKATKQLHPPSLWHARSSSRRLHYILSS